MEHSAASAGIQAGKAGSWGEVFRRRPIAASIATCFGVGFLPIAPGTWGSLAALAIGEVVFRFFGLSGLAVAAAVTTLGGIPAADRASKLVGKDPSPVVIDEVAGQLLASLGVYAFCPRTGLMFPALVGISFLLFRVVDVLKPGPIGRSESLPGGIGIMADDVLGGAATGVVMAIVAKLFQVLAA